jgi:hypothetical protein
MLMFVEEFHVSILFELEVVSRAEIHEIVYELVKSCRKCAIARLFVGISSVRYSTARRKET